MADMDNHFGDLGASLWGFKGRGGFMNSWVIF